MALADVFFAITYRDTILDTPNGPLLARGLDDLNQQFVINVITTAYNGSSTARAMFDRMVAKHKLMIAK